LFRRSQLAEECREAESAALEIETLENRARATPTLPPPRLFMDLFALRESVLRRIFIPPLGRRELLSSASPAIVARFAVRTS